MGSSLQPVDFKSYDEFLEFLPENERELVVTLNALILDSASGMRRKLSYNVPYYSLNRRVCFIWPASVPWGKVKLQGVQLGFCSGYMLEDPTEFLDRGGRKQVCSKTYFKLGELTADVDLIRHFLFEAIEIDRQQKNKKG